MTLDEAMTELGQHFSRRAPSGGKMVLTIEEKADRLFEARSNGTRAVGADPTSAVRAMLQLYAAKTAKMLEAEHYQRLAGEHE